ncbi:replication initiation protein RepM [Neisseria sp. CCUG17229]|uniref:replication initiation protein RepM n=1 Tax=Neisseria sp. CCUG17229 TaxID=3392036 RepID=UPI003A102B6E
MKNDLVKKSNSLNEAHYFLTVAEYRILHMAFSTLAECDVNPEFFRNVRFTIRARDYMELYGVDRTTAYQALREASERLFDRYFTYDELVDKNLMLYERIKSRWVTKIGYLDSQAYITFFLSDDVLSMVGNLKEQYTYLNLYKLANLTSIYAIRVYEMLMQWRKTKTVPVIELEELRFRLGIAENEYPRMDNFKSRVLDTAIQQINEFTDITTSYEQIKDGRKITGFRFSYKDKVKQPKALPNKTERDPTTVDIFDGFTDLERQTIQQCIDEHIERLETKGETVGEYWRENITKKAIAEKWGLDVLAEQQRKEREYKTRLAIKQAEMQAKARAEQEKAEKAEQRKKAMIAKFESLPHDEQERVLNEVGEKVGGVFGDFYKRARENGTAHKDVMFMSWFFKILEC